MAVKKSTTMEKLLPADFFKKIAGGEYRTDYYPKFSDREAWKKVRKCEVADRVIAMADKAVNSRSFQHRTLFIDNIRSLVTGQTMNIFSSRVAMNFLFLRWQSV